METEQVQEQIVPASTTSDFGEGVLEMENELLDKMNEPEVPEGEAVESEPVVEDVPVAAAPVQDVPVFDVNGRVQLQAGQPITADHIKELERGFLREKDYTQKTQQIAEIRQEAEQVLQTQQEIMQNPALLRNYFEPKQLLGAFTQQEMLNYGLAAAKVTPQMWNQFLEWHKEAGFTEQAPQANPFAEQFSTLEQKLAKQEQMLQQWQSKEQQREAMEIQNRQQQAYNQEMSRIESEAKQALKDFPDVNERHLYVEMAASDGMRSWAELAKSIHLQKEADKNAWADKKQTVKLNSAKPAKGQPVNIVQRQPKSFDEADELIDKVYGGRANFR